MRNIRKGYTQAVLKFTKLDTQAQQREAIAQGRSLSPYRLRYKIKISYVSLFSYSQKKLCEICVLCG
ncbi:MAG: hypothetical protein LBJ00_11745 [Planctomycetaceae bacterium]|nr:hypothetical protein [Planctomycetaceae bacterium]